MCGGVPPGEGVHPSSLVVSSASMVEGSPRVSPHASLPTCLAAGCTVALQSLCPTPATHICHPPRHLQRHQGRTAPTARLPCCAPVQVRAGTGGEEAALWAADLIRMYSKYADTQGWKVSPLSESVAESGGYKECILQITGDRCAGHAVGCMGRAVHAVGCMGHGVHAAAWPALWCGMRCCMPA